MLRSSTCKPANKQAETGRDGITDSRRKGVQAGEVKDVMGLYFAD